MMSLVIVSVVMVALGSVVVISAKAAPNGKSLTDTVLQGGRGVDQLTQDLRAAVYVLEHTDKSVKVVVPDRTGDGVPDTVRYAWTGPAGAALTRQFNGGAVEKLLDQAQLFKLTWLTTNVTESYPGPIVEEPEQALSSYDPPSLWSAQDFSVTKDKWPGQYFKPTMPAGALHWRVTRVLFMARRSGGSSQILGVSLHPATNDGLPIGTLLEKVTIPEANFGSSYSWQEFTFSNVTGRVPGSDLALLLNNETGGQSTGLIRFDSSADKSGGSGLLSTSNYGSSWNVNSGKALQHYVYGRVTVQHPDQSITRQAITGARLVLQTTSDSRSTIHMAVRMLNVPQVLTGLWELDFSADPTAIDLHGDGQADWTVPNGTFSTGSLVNGRWQASGSLVALPAQQFNAPTTVELRCRDTVANTPGPALWMHLDFTGNTLAVIYTDLSLQADGTQTFTLYNRISGTTAQTLASVTGLPAGFVDVRMVLDPVMDTVYLKLNGVRQGTYRYARHTVASAAPLLAIFPWGSGSEFDSIRVLVGGTSP